MCQNFIFEIVNYSVGTWHSNYIEYLKYYFIEWILGPAFHRYLKGFFEQIPTVYVPTTYVCSNYSCYN